MGNYTTFDIKFGLDVEKFSTWVDLLMKTRELLSRPYIEPRQALENEHQFNDFVKQKKITEYNISYRVTHILSEEVKTFYQQGHVVIFIKGQTKNYDNEIEVLQDIALFFSKPTRRLKKFLGKFSSEMSDYEKYLFKTKDGTRKMLFSDAKFNK